MGVFEAVVVFIIAWWIVFLPSLSAGTRSQHEAGSVSPGSDRGAPEKVVWLPKILIATGGAAAITLLLWLALHFNWLDFAISRD